MENNSESTISNEVEITGTIMSSGSVRFDGKLEGEMQCAGDATIGKTASIKGNLDVNSIVVEGTVQGNITAKDKIELKQSAKVTGDIKSKRLAVEDGVTFVGRSEVNPSGSVPPAQPPPPNKAAANGEADKKEKAGVFKR